MSKKNYFSVKELRALAELLEEATIYLADLTENTNKSIVSDIVGFTFHNIRRVNKFVHKGIDNFFAKFNQEANLKIDIGNKINILSVLNGIVGDHLEAQNSALAIQMQIKKSESKAKNKILIMVHGLCMNDEQWNWQGHNHGEKLAAQFDMSVVYLHYNTGRHISTNGEEFDQQIQKLVDTWAVPITDIFIVAHSMGGLVSRSAVHYAEKRGASWRSLLRKICFLGSPHHGAPVERLGGYVDFILESLPIIAPFARIGKIRSKGIEDLRFGNIKNEDWQNIDSANKFKDMRELVQLPSDVNCYAIAGVLGEKDCTWKVRILGDSLVQIESALGQHWQKGKNLNFKPEHTLIVYQTNHFELLSSAIVYAQLEQWLSI